MPVLDPTPVRRGRAVPARPSSRRTAAGPLPVRGRSPVRGGADLRRRPALAMVGALVLAATALRLAIPRGLWLDEAISVREGLESLGENCQDILDRFFCRDESYNTIGEALDLPAGTIASRISRCLAKLRDFFGEEGRNPAA